MWKIGSGGGSEPGCLPSVVVACICACVFRGAKGQLAISVLFCHSECLGLREVPSGRSLDVPECTTGVSCVAFLRSVCAHARNCPLTCAETQRVTHPVQKLHSDLFLLKLHSMSRDVHFDNKYNRVRVWVGWCACMRLSEFTAIYPFYAQLDRTTLATSRVYTDCTQYSCCLHEVAWWFGQFWAVHVAFSMHCSGLDDNKRTETT